MTVLTFAGRLVPFDKMKNDYLEKRVDRLASGEGHGLSDSGPCAEANALLRSRPEVPVAEPLPPLEESLIDRAPDRFWPQGAGVLSLEAAAERKADDDLWRVALNRFRFTRGYHSDWRLDDSTFLGAEVYEFETPQGAIRADSFATQVGCTYANDVFKVDRYGIGLQTRTSGITEQVSFVVGSRRFVIFLTSAEAPTDHKAIRRLARASMGNARGSGDKVPTPTQTEAVDHCQRSSALVDAVKKHAASDDTAYPIPADGSQLEGLVADEGPPGWTMWVDEQSPERATQFGTPGAQFFYHRGWEIPETYIEHQLAYMPSTADAERYLLSHLVTLCPQFLSLDPIDGVPGGVVFSLPEQDTTVYTAIIVRGPFLSLVWHATREKRAAPEFMDLIRQIDAKFAALSADDVL